MFDCFLRRETRRKLALKQFAVPNVPLRMRFLAYSSVTRRPPIGPSYFGDCVFAYVLFQTEVFAKVFRLKLGYFVEHVYGAHWTNSTCNGFVFVS